VAPNAARKTVSLGVPAGSTRDFWPSDVLRLRASNRFGSLEPIYVSHNVAGARENALLGAGGRWFESSRPDQNSSLRSAFWSERRLSFMRRAARQRASECESSRPDHNFRSPLVGRPFRSSPNSRHPPLVGNRNESSRPDQNSSLRSAFLFGASARKHASIQNLKPKSVSGRSVSSQVSPTTAPAISPPKSITR